MQGVFNLISTRCTVNKLSNYTHPLKNIKTEVFLYLKIIDASFFHSDIELEEMPKAIVRTY